MDTSVTGGQCLNEVQIPLCAEGPGPTVGAVDCWLPIGVELLAGANEREGQQASIEDVRWLFGRLESHIDARFEDLNKRLNHLNHHVPSASGVDLNGASDMMIDRQDTMIALSTMRGDLDKERDPPLGPRVTPPAMVGKSTTRKSDFPKVPPGLKRISENLARLSSRAKSLVPTMSEERSLKDSRTIRGRLSQTLNSTGFEALMCTIILANVCAFGFEVQARVSHHEGEEPVGFKVLEVIFALSFCTELTMRLIAYGLRQFFFGSNRCWNMIDTILVVTSLPELALDLIFQKDPELSYLGIIREARTLRIVRVIRILHFFKPLRILMDSVANTLRDLGWMLLLILIIIYTFGVVFTFAASMSKVNELDDDVKERVHEYFGSLYSSILCLFKATTGGIDWSAAGDALDAVHPVWGVLFLVYIIFCNLAVFNVVTGVVCHTAIETAQQDRDFMIQSKANDRARYTKRLQELFSSFDEDHSGKLTLGDFEEKLHMDDGLQKYFDAMELTVHQALDLFKLLDIHNTGEIETDDFVAGCLKLRGQAKSIDMHMLMYQSKWTMNKMVSLTRAVNGLSERLGGPPVASTSNGRSRGVPTPSAVKRQVSTPPIMGLR